MISPQAEAGKFLRSHKYFSKLKPYIDYYDGESGHSFKSIETFTLRFPLVENTCCIYGKECLWVKNPKTFEDFKKAGFPEYRPRK